jgi:hypothetical protein
MVETLGSRVVFRFSAYIVLAGMLAVGLFSCSPPEVPTPAAYEETNPLGRNAACYVCHMQFVREELSKVHLRAEVTCVHCHGISAGHANDENIGATPPDIVFSRAEVDAMCLECHSLHAISDEAAAGRPPSPVCTDCHGTHRIAASSSIESE